MSPFPLDGAVHTYREGDSVYVSIEVSDAPTAPTEIPIRLSAGAIPDTILALNYPDPSETQDWTAADTSVTVLVGETAAIFAFEITDDGIAEQVRQSVTSLSARPRPAGGSGSRDPAMA
ncbi:MAG: hypothetical protein F4029_02330 [Gammaproteobacteria bacterium]|nr:hypothetical protein [Gammaproteobacteria bacterium]MYK45046.1 hypothetical protein [Gammaproteobacteria bacterium]